MRAGLNTTERDGRGWARRLVSRLASGPSRRAGYRSLIATHVPGRTFMDVGCMWMVHGDYLFHALACGATAATGVDIMDATPEFTTRNGTVGDRVRFVQADVNDPTLAERIGPADVLFCAGVLYHVPNPLLTLARLRSLCRETLILGSVTIPEREDPQAMIYLPHLDARAKRALDLPPDVVKVGVDTRFSREEEYANWFWAFTPSSVEGLLRTAGFDIRERRDFRRGVVFACRAPARDSASKLSA